MFRAILQIFSFLSKLMLFGFAFAFLQWFAKGLVGKYFWAFWLWLIIAVGTVIGHRQEVEDSYDHRTGAQVWEERNRTAN